MSAGDIFVSAVIKARNEERNLPDCIASLKGLADEVIIVDDGSTDRTAEIAAAAGARVIRGARSPGEAVEVLDRQGFAAAAGQWIVYIDADERMEPALARELLDIARSGRFNGARFARKNIMFGDWPRYGGWFKPEQLRFLRADAWDRSWTCRIHQQVPVAPPIATIPATPELSTLHLDYDDVATFVRRTLLNYASTDAAERIAAGARPSALRLILKPIKKFVGRFVIRGGFRDGYRGLVLAGLLAAYDFLIEAHIWDASRGDPR